MKHSLLTLFLTFLKLGFICFGGPIAHLGFLGGIAAISGFLLQPDHLRRPFQAILQVYRYWTIERPVLLKSIEDLCEDVDIKNRLLCEKIRDQEDLCDKLDKNILIK